MIITDRPDINRFDHHDNRMNLYRQYHAAPARSQPVSPHRPYIHHQTRRHLKRVKSESGSLNLTSPPAIRKVTSPTSMYARFQIKQRHHGASSTLPGCGFSTRQDGFAISRTSDKRYHRLHAGQLRRIAGKRHGRKG